METSKQITLEPGVVTHVPIDLLIPDPDQPRKDFDDGPLSELAQDIKLRGIKHPILVRPDPLGNLWVVDGERRWRASQLAKLKTVRVLLDETDPAITAEEEPLERLFEQVAVNHHRSPLNAMDWAQLLTRLHEGFGWSAQKIADELKARGIQNMSRPYITNLMRLLALPDWAKKMINDGDLTASHGKYLVPIAGDSKLLDWVKKEINQEFANGEAVTTSSLEELVDDAYDSVYIDLSCSWGSKAPRFSIKKECANCPNKVTVKGKYRETEYCKDKTCFEKKQEAADAAGSKADPSTGSKKDKKPPKAPKVNDDGVVSLKNRNYETYNVLRPERLDMTGCEGCEFNQLASHNGKKDEDTLNYCFNADCFRKKVSAFSRDRNRLERVAELLDDWVREQVTMRLTGDYRLQMQLLVFMALAMPEGPTNNDWFGFDDDRLNDMQRSAVEITGLNRLQKIFDFDDKAELPVEEIVKHGVHAMNRDNLYCVAHHLGIELTADNYQYDEAYIETHNKGSALKVLQESGVAERIDGIEKETLLKLKDRILDNQATIGVPSDVLEAFRSHGTGEAA